MKKAKSFNIGDKVFAKVKGYPAWPAKIVGENGKKYDVTFYGTRETGSIKVEDLFYYLKHKEQFCKNLKRKDYIEAVEQIEAEIEETGTDGNDENNVADETVPGPGTVEKKGKKRKRSKSIDKSQINDESPVKKSVRRRNSMHHTSSEDSQMEVLPEEKIEKDEKEESVQGTEVSEPVKTIAVSPKNTTAPTSRSGRVIKLKKFDSEEDDEEKKTTKRGRSLGAKETQNDITKLQNDNKKDVATTPKMKKSSSDSVKEESTMKKEIKTHSVKKFLGNKEKITETEEINNDPEDEGIEENQNTEDKVPEDAKKETTVNENLADEGKDKLNMEEQTDDTEDEMVEKVESKENLEKEQNATVEEEKAAIEEIDENKENTQVANKRTGKIHEKSQATPEVKDIEPSDISIVPISYLKAVIAYANYIRSKETIYKEKPVEPREKQKNEVVITKLPSGKLVGIKYDVETLSDCETEFSRAEAEEVEAKTILSLKDYVENGNCKLEDDPNMFVMNISLSEAEIQERNESKIIECKKKKLKFLKAESGFVELDSKIKSCLGLDKAEPKNALEYMESMLKLEITPLMLKKHPHIADMVKRLRRYVGNIKEWNLTGDSLETFEVDAEKIREKAEEVFLKFKSLFKIPEESSFWDTFSAEVDKFKNDTKDMKETEIFTLCTEPGTRQAFFDFYEEQEELQKLENEQKQDISNEDIKSESENKENSSAGAS